MNEMKVLTARHIHRYHNGGRLGEASVREHENEAGEDKAILMIALGSSSTSSMPVILTENDFPGGLSVKAKLVKPCVQ